MKILTPPVARGGDHRGAVLFDRSSQRGGRREQSTSARRAAEALFARKPQPAEPAIREAAPHESRVPAVAAAAPIQRDEPEAPADIEPPKKSVIPMAHVTRIRAWMKYGMTAPQIAEVYGVPVGEIERLRRKG